MCFFQQLYMGDDGYVVRCKDCGYYQLVFGTSLLTLSQAELQSLREMVTLKLAEALPGINEDMKCMWLPAPSFGFAMMLTIKELNVFAAMLEEADTEEKALALLNCFGDKE